MWCGSVQESCGGWGGAAALACLEGERVAVAPATKHGGGAGAHALVLEPLGISIEAQEEAEGQDSADLRHTSSRVKCDLA